jgi:hypothetical protein
VPAVRGAKERQGDGIYAGQNEEAGTMWCKAARILRAKSRRGKKNLRKFNPLPIFWQGIEGFVRQLRSAGRHPGG